MTRSCQFADSTLLSSKLIKNATLKIFKDAPRGLCAKRKHEINDALLEFSRA